MPRVFHFRPLWPFRDFAEVDAWRRQFRTNGSQPWHLDADQTALSFTTGFLGFTDIDEVIRHDIRATEAWVTVGYSSDSGKKLASAILHLARFESTPDAPWEVVGSRDTDLVLSIPDYGARITSPVLTGGTISGVDEAIQVDIRQPSSRRPLGSHCCLPGGGTRTPWQVRVRFSGASDPGITIVAWSGGHIQKHERFAITAARP